MHWPLQTISGRPQVLLQTPPKQRSLGPHGRLQAPQLF
jgi:hypothetical protein